MSKLEYVVTRVGEHEEQVRTHVTIANALDIDLTTDGDSMSVYRRSSVSYTHLTLPTTPYV